MSLYIIGIFLGVVKILNIFWGMPDIPDIFCIQLMLCPSQRMKKRMRAPPPPPPRIHVGYQKTPLNEKADNNCRE